MPSNDAAKIIIDSHEERLQRLEHGYQQTSNQTAELGVKIDFLTKSVSEKIDNAVDRIAEKVDNSTEKVDRLSKNLSSLTPRVEHLERKEEERATKETEQSRKKIRRSARFRQVVLPIFLAGAGVVATKLGELLWMWLSHGH